MSDSAPDNMSDNMSDNAPTAWMETRGAIEGSPNRPLTLVQGFERAALAVGCASGCLDLAEHAAEAAGEPDETALRVAFMAACLSGSAEVLEWLVRRFPPCRQYRAADWVDGDPRSPDTIARAKGHAAVARWLVNRLDYTPEDFPGLLMP